MRKSRFNEEQIVTRLKEADAGVPIGELGRRLGVSEGDFLSLEDQVRRIRTERGATVEGPGRRKRTTIGFVIQLFVAPPEPGYISTWAEFKRSGWIDPSAFGVANTLDSGFTHLVIAPVVALVLGGVASLIARPRSGAIVR